ncbi:VOC family protein [Pseudarthrobacter sp. J1738]|uniref:VOC family protein n=1 Tax=unclassified Pseudarthrobacter TaxID=2647000 RepID=UPI003D268FBD
MNDDLKGVLHHVEIWVPELNRATREWGWVLDLLGYEIYQSWENGISWRLGSTYIVFEESSDMTGREHNRTSPGLNHLAFHAGTRENVDAMVGDSAAQGWAPLFADKYPNAGGLGNYAAYLVNSDGFEIELIAAD